MYSCYFSVISQVLSVFFSCFLFLLQEDTPLFLSVAPYHVFRKGMAGGGPAGAAVQLGEFLFQFLQPGHLFQGFSEIPGKGRLGPGFQGLDVAPGIREILDDPAALHGTFPVSILPAPAPFHPYPQVLGRHVLVHRHTGTADAAAGTAVAAGIAHIVQFGHADLFQQLIHFLRPLGRQGIEEAYRTGRGKIRIQAVSEIEPMANGKHRIVFTEPPYEVNPEKALKDIADLVKEKKIDGITDLRNESNKDGIRLCVELRRDANPNLVLNQIYKHTELLTTYGVIMLALNKGEPKVMNLEEVLHAYLDHQEEVVTRRTKYDLNKAEERAHIIEGLLIALDNIDEVIRIVRSARTVQLAKDGLIARFGLSDAQAQAIVDMRIRVLTGLEREKLENEYADLQEKIAEWKAILGDEKLLLGVIKEELLITAEKYGDDRKTKIGADMDELTDEDTIPDEPVVIAMTNLGYIKRMSVGTFKSQNRGGRGVKGMQTLEEDYIRELFITTTHNYIMFFTNKGKTYRMKGYEIPEASRTSRGVAIVNLLQLAPEEKITAVIPIKTYDEGKFFVMATRDGIVKKTSVTEYANVRRNGLAAINLKEDDELIEVKVTSNKDDVLLITKLGQCIRFHETDVRVTGRVSMGVIGMKLEDGDEVVTMQMSNQGDDMLIVSELGMGKRTRMDEFSPQNRGGKGVKCYKIHAKTGNVVGAKAVKKDQELMMITTEGIVIRIPVNSISRLGRITSGVKLINLAKGVKVASIAKVRAGDTSADLEKDVLSDDTLEKMKEEQ